MGYSKNIYQAAALELKTRRENAQRIAEQHKMQFIQQCPTVIDIESEMAKTGMEAVKAVGAGENALEIVTRLAKYNLELQAKRKELLVECGFPTNYLQPSYTCPICEDTGSKNGVPCSCYEKLLKDLAYQELAKSTPLKLCDFNTFSLLVYSDKPNKNGIVPRKQMSMIFETSKNYADTFSAQSKSLFLYGLTGLGKTHLSLAIANEVIKKGYGVVYDTTQNLISKLEKERFGRTENTDTESLILDCDLLILDDLGTEFVTNFSVAAIYNIINTRGLCQKPTIINCNIDIQELKKVYTDRIVSRIFGSYTALHFIGNDQRIARRTE